jgi:UDP-N-acetyl-D-galactosamine dehydrogenase
MGKYIADQTIKLMINNEKKIKNSDILVLGLTFKEDCPDIRNTKVIDIIEELKLYGCNVDVFDPWVNQNEKKKRYTHGIIKNPFKVKKTYDAIVVAVAHKQFKKLKQKDYLKISNNPPIIIDIKGIIKNPSWRL